MSKINIKRYISDVFEANCYLLNFKNSLQESISVVIDPCVDYNLIKKDIKGDLKAILITHGHFDHFKSLQSYLNIATTTIYFHKNALEKIASPVKNCSKLIGMNCSFDYSKFKFETISEEILELFFQNKEKISINVLETPGHSNCSLTYLVDDYMFSGDFIFQSSVGRTDLYTGSQFTLLESIKKIKQLKKDYIIYPGHDNETSLFKELKYNEYLK